MTVHAPAGRLDVLQLARGAAAILVVLYHANDFVLPLRLYDGGIAWRGFGWGYAGVEFFFVLSGFIIGHVHHRDIGNPVQLRTFLVKRALRIFPMYWLVLTAVLLAYALLPSLGTELPRTESALLAYLLWPSADRPVLPVAWTLKHEMLFYLVFAGLLVHARMGMTVFFVWMTGCLIFLFLPPASFPAAFLFSPYNLLFAVGLGVFFMRPNLRQPVARRTAVTGILLFVGIGMSEQFLFAWPLGVRTIAYGLAASLLLVGALQLRIKVPAPGVLLGDASYAIYLVHLPVMNVCAILLRKTGAVPAAEPLLICLGLSAAAVAAGVVAHLLLERPLLARIRLLRKDQPLQHASSLQKGPAVSHRSR